MYSVYLLGVAALLASARVATAQVVSIPANLPATGPRGSTSTVEPISQFYGYSGCEVIYLRSQLNQNGLITRLAFDKQGGNTTTPLDRVVVYLKHTGATALTTGAIDSAGYQRVFKGSFPNNLLEGFLEVVLQQPFAYNNADNLAVLVVRTNGVFTRTNPVSWYFQAGQPRQAARYGADLAPLTRLTADNVIPHVRFTFDPATATRRPQPDLAPVYPLPATDELNLPATQLMQVSVTDELGRIVRSAVWLYPVGGRISISVADLPAGNYFLRGRTTSGAISNQRFVRR